jgi:hypothetical protein
MIKNPPGKTEISEIKTCNHFYKRRKILIGGGAFTSALLLRPLLTIAQTEHSDGARKINLSGRQRMLIQRAGKFVCLASLSPKPIPLLAAAEETLALHQRTEAGLNDGDDELGLEPEANASILKALTRAKNTFSPYGQTIRDAIERRVIEKEHLQKIAELNGHALGEMDAAVKLIERVYKSTELSEQRAMLINIAGRQRMFTQRLVLLLCLSRSGVVSNDTRQKLFITMNRFSISLNILKRVTPEALHDASSQPIIQRLSSVQGDWEALRALISIAAWTSEDQLIRDILQADKQAEELLKRMSAIVLLYEEAVS